MARWFPAISGYYLIAGCVVVLLAVTQQVLLNAHEYDTNSILAFLGLTSQKDEYTCSQPAYTARIASYSPLVIHLENFLTPYEATHLIALGTPLLQPSFVFAPGSDTDPKHKARARQRSSSSAYLRSPDPVVDCVRRRAAVFQGGGGHALALAHMETLQMVRYGEAEQFHLHRDWGRRSPAGWERTTTFFAYLRAECGECGTWFPHLTLEGWGEGEREEEEGWCRLAECESKRNGTTFRALGGSAVFWRNLGDDGVGDNRTLHAGLPPESGEKIGLNIWTREGPG